MDYIFVSRHDLIFSLVSRHDFLRIWKTGGGGAAMSSHHELTTRKETTNCVVTEESCHSFIVITLYVSELTKPTLTLLQMK